MNYKFDWLNGGATIENPTVNWTKAWFDVGNETIGLTISLVVPQANFEVDLQRNGIATDRSDEAINVLMNELLQPYVVE